ncbi:MAG: hypothetical protein U0T81_08570 [Saprospiraceae bacterium]
MIASIDPQTLTIAMIWMVVGLVIHFGFSRKYSKLRAYADILPTADDFEAKKND